MADQEAHTVIGIHITDRLKEAVKVQTLLTEYGNQIKMRLGLHDIQTGKAGLNGLVLLEIIQPEKRITELMDKLNAIEGVEAKRMDFEHPV